MWSSYWTKSDAKMLVAVRGSTLEILQQNVTNKYVINNGKREKEILIPRDKSLGSNKKKKKIEHFKPSLYKKWLERIVVINATLVTWANVTSHDIKQWLTHFYKIEQIIVTQSSKSLIIV